MLLLLATERRLRLFGDGGALVAALLVASVQAWRVPPKNKGTE